VSKDDSGIWRVVINLEEQYSILRESERNPDGWRDVGKQGSKAECLAYILENWTDMRPMSMRKKMDEMLAKNKTN
jgi:MbtH protein